VAFTIIFSLAGLLAGMLAGYFGSSVMISANARTYNMTGLVKGVNLPSILFGLGIPLLTFAFTMFVCGFNMYKKENGALLSDKKQSDKPSKILSFADNCVKKLPLKNKASLRIALRRPLSILLILIASGVFTVFLALGWSITTSSEAEYQTQAQEHNYNYEYIFKEIQTDSADKDGLYYLSQKGFIYSVNGELYEYDDEDDKIQQTLFGMDENDDVYSLLNTSKEKLSLPKDGYCYISIGLAEIRNIKIGDQLIIKTQKENVNDGVTIENKTLTLTVQDIAYNAKKNTIITSRVYLGGTIGVNGYSGVLSKENIYPEITYKYDTEKIGLENMVMDNEAREDMLNRARNSTGKGAVINQTIGLGSGIAVIFLALFIAFQDSVKDMLIMDTLGYRKREIRKLLINVFLPILILCFVIMAAPSVLLAKMIQASTARATGDYSPFMPIGTTLLVLLAGLAIIITVYWIVQLIFSLGIKRTIKKKGILEYTNTL